MSSIPINDIIFIVTITTINIFIIFFRKKNKHKEELSEKAHEGETLNKPLRDTDIIICSALRELQCEPEVKKIDETTYHINFDFQTENFVIVCNKTNRFIQLYDVWWYNFSLEDIDQLAKVKRIINELNWESGANVSYEVKEDKKMVCVNISRGMVCLDEINFKEYLRSTMFEIFTTHYMFFKKMAESK